METRIRLDRHTAAAFKSDITEINILQKLAETLTNCYKRHMDALVADAGYEPKEYADHRLTDEGGETYLVLTPPKSVDVDSQMKVVA